MGKCPAGEGIPSPSQKPPPPGSAPSPATSNAVCPSEGRGRERACRSEPPPRPRAPVGPERQDGPEDHRAAERGSSAAPDLERAVSRPALGCPPHATKRAARGHTARPAGPRAAGRGYQPGDPGPLSAPPANGQGREQHSPSGRRHVRPEPASREVRHQLSPAGSPLREAGAGRGRSPCPAPSRVQLREEPSPTLGARARDRGLSTVRGFPQALETSSQPCSLGRKPRAGDGESL